MHPRFKLAAAALVCFACSLTAHSQARPAQDAATIAHRNAIEKELEAIAIIERKVMVPMRDGKRMQADIYRPKDESKKYPIIFSPHALQLQLLGRRRWARRATCPPSSTRSSAATPTSR